MTEQKALEIAIHCLGVQAEQEVCEECQVYGESGIICKEVAIVAISALKEIQQYREIGTVEECRTLASIVNKVERNELAKIIDEWLGYSKIGTVEECRAYKRNGWIPVKERLPEWEGRYLVTFRNPRNVGLVGYGTCRRDLFGREIGFGWYDLHEAEYFSRDAVIAWMPLPEPYREEREDCETE